MPLTEEQALESARRLIKHERRSLPFPVANNPVRQKYTEDSEPPKVAPEYGVIGRDFWEFYFEFQPPASLMVDPTCARVFVDATTGNAALFSFRYA